MALGLTVGGITGGAVLSATAAPGDPITAAWEEGAPSANDFFGGTDLVISNLVAASTNTVHVFVAPAADPTNFTEVTSANYTIPAAEVDAAGTAVVTLQLRYYDSSIDFYTQLNPGDVVRTTIEVDDSPQAALNTYVIPGTITPPVVVDPAGSFTDTSITGAEFIAGTPFVLTNLDPTKANNVRVYVEQPAPTFGYSLFQNFVIAPADITNGSATINVVANHGTGVPVSTANHVQVRLSEDNDTNEVELATATVAGVPPVPPVPTGSFSDATITGAEFLNGTPFTIIDLDDTKVNEVRVYVQLGSGSYTLFNAFPLEEGDITNTVAEINVSANNAGAALTDGDSVQVRLSVNDDTTELTLATRAVGATVVVPDPEPVVPAGEFVGGTPTAAELIEGVDYTINDLDPAASNVVRVYAQVPGGEFELVGTPFTIDPDDIVDGTYILDVAVYILDGGDTVVVPAGTVVRITLEVDGAAEVVLSEVTIGAAVVAPPTGGGDGLAQTGTADDRTIQNAGLGLMGGSLALGLFVVGVLVMRRRKEASEEMGMANIA